jgi:predicted Fe-Mo cluster-binding NifX family protein
MKIAVPVKMNKKDSAVAPLFGKAKWFALIDGENIDILPNEVGHGVAVIDWLRKLGVDTLIIQEMGVSPYNKIVEYGDMKIYHAGFERITLSELLKEFKEGKLAYLDEKKMQEIIAHHEKKHPHKH